MKPLVISSGKIKQLPSGSTLEVNASASGAASINLPHGSAPSSPSNGDCWTTTSGLFCRVNGSTVGPYGTGGGSGIDVEEDGSNEGSGIITLNFTTGLDVSVSGSKATISASGGGGGGTWALAGAGQTATGVWDFAVDGAKSTIDFTGLTGSDIKIVCVGITQSVSGIPFVQVGNGGSFFTASGDYKVVSTAGVETNSGGVALIDTAATAARSCSCIFEAVNITGAPKDIIPQTRANAHRFVANNNPVDRVRLATTGGGNFNGGKVFCYTR